MTTENNEAQVEQIEAPQITETEVENTEVTEAHTDVETETTPEQTLAEKQISQDEFNKLYFQLKQAERERDAALKKKEAEQTPAKETKAEPKLEDFEYDKEQYTQAMIDYKINEKVQEALSNQANSQKQTQAQAEQAAINATFNEKAAAFASTNPDYEKVIEANGANAVYSQTLREAIITSEYGPQLDYAMLSNPQLLDKLNSLSPVQAAREIGKLEASYTKPTPTPAKKVSSAPEPVPVSGGGGRASSDYSYNEEMDMNSYYEAYMAAQRAKNGQ